ncbi:NAD(P)-dependent oxidoreductase [Arsukibacterium sp.]|uniref:NAD(P)-dependent oxidoreductase n=1 Tax=Arsukibacterium sp. TaxID=1977258 RepID=UPI002FD9EFC3
MHSHTAAAQVINRLQQADIAIVNKVKLDASVLAALPQLSAILVAATGMDNIDLNAARQRGIKVSNVQHYADTAVPQQVFAMLLALSNQLLPYQRAVQQGRWQQSQHFCFMDYPITELAGKTMTLVGYGSLGQRVATLAEAFGMTVVIAERVNAAVCRPGRTPFEQALAKADVVSLHCPLNEDTHQLMNAARLAMMKPTAILINSARGALVDSAALLQALTQGQLAAAAIDLLAAEPPDANEPLLQTPLDNLLITPHVGWASQQARQHMVQILSSQLYQLLSA